jgi:hypothetical protein
MMTDGFSGGLVVPALIVRRGSQVISTIASLPGCYPLAYLDKDTWLENVRALIDDPFPLASYPSQDPSGRAVDPYRPEPGQYPAELDLDELTHGAASRGGSRHCPSGAPTSCSASVVSATLPLGRSPGLENFAKRRIPITYQELAKALQILPPRSIHRVTEALERLMEEDAAARRPFIAALAICKVRGGLPAPGFFDCARRLGRFAGDPDGQHAWSFHAAELNAVFARWGGPRDN